MRKKESWKCSEGCTNPDCEHLQAILNKATAPRRDWVGLVANMDSFASQDTSLSRDEQIKTLIFKLKQYALDDLRIFVLILKVEYELSFAEIAKDLNIPHKQIAWYLFKSAKKILKERGYK